MKIQKIGSAMLAALVLASQSVGIGAVASGDIAAEEIIGTVESNIAAIYTPLAEKPDTNGIVTNTDGTVSYLCKNKVQTGLFSVTPDYTKGDLSNDQKVDAGDAEQLLAVSATAAANALDAGEILAKSSDAISNSYQALQIADVNNDQAINAADAADVLMYSAQLGAGEQVHPLGYAIYYADETGVLQNGWIKDGETTYYGKEDYSLCTGWNTIDNQSYYFTEDGKLVSSGLMTISGKTYYFDQTAVFLANAWVDVEGAMHYFGADGAMLTGLQEIDGKIYDLGKDGALQSGWTTTADGVRMIQSDGTPVLGWYAQDGKNYYFDETTGYMATGWYDVEDKTFHFDEDGTMLTGDTYIDGVKYKCNEDGSYQHLKICVDAGHYGKYNHSPVNSAYWESDFTWAFHILLVDALRERGVEVITTREDKEKDLALESRGFCSEGCDLFLSVHSNACNSPSVDGPLACCCISGEMNDLGQQLADLVAKVMETNQGGSIWNRYYPNTNDTDYYGVLRGAAKVGTPGILLEHSYHTNLRATYWLMDSSNLERMANAEADLLVSYFGMD